MKTVYKSKVDKGLLIAIIAIVLLSYLPLLFEFSWIALALLVVTAAFIADPFCNTSYTIDTWHAAYQMRHILCRPPSRSTE